MGMYRWSAEQGAGEERHVYCAQVYDQSSLY